MNGDTGLELTNQELPQVDFARATVAARPDIGQQSDVRQAEHNLSWAEMFQSTPPTEVLRARRDFTDLVSNAVTRKMAIQAQTSSKAADLYFKTEKFNQWQQDQPLRDQLMQARIEAQGASTRYKAWKESETASQTSAFFNGLPDIESKFSVGTPEYATAYAQHLAKYPLAASTSEVRDITKTHATLDDTQAQLRRKLDALPAGMKPESIDFTSGGGVNLRVKSNDPLASYGLNQQQFDNPASVRVGNWKIENEGTANEKRTFNGKNDGNVVEIDTGATNKSGKAVKSYMPISEYQRLGGKLAPDQQAVQPNASTTPTSAGNAKHLGRYNPKTQEFE